MTNTTIADEHNSLYKILNFRLPNSFKKLGLAGAILIFAFLLAYKFVGSDALIIKDLLRTFVLLFLLLASLSKDKIEDEYIRHIKLQSCLISFVFTAVYYILIPFLAIVLDYLITSITGDGSVSFYEVSAFEVLFTMLGMQLLCFEALKRFGRV